jgi:hypothetical protein
VTRSPSEPAEQLSGEAHALAAEVAAAGGLPLRTRAQRRRRQENVERGPMESEHVTDSLQVPPLLSGYLGVHQRLRRQACEVRAMRVEDVATGHAPRLRRGGEIVRLGSGQPPILQCSVDERQVLGLPCLRSRCGGSWRLQ